MEVNSSDSGIVGLWTLVYTNYVKNKRLIQSEKGTTLMEVLIALAIFIIVAVIVIPNIGHFADGPEDEAMSMEYATLQFAIHIMMADNNLSSLPVTNLVNTLTEATSDMTNFPCSDGSYVLHGNMVSGTTVNYLDTETSSYRYYTDSLGTLYQQ